MKTLRYLTCIILFCLLLAPSAKATPYASAITNLNGNGTPGGTIQYRLNEPCTNVYVIYYPGAVSNNLGMNGTYTTTPANGACVGVHTFSLVYNSVTYSSFAIHCDNIGTGIPHWISPANGTAAQQAPGNGFNPGTNNIVDFYGPRGVGVNKNPSSPYFGTIYVVNSSANTDGTGRNTGRGIYAINPDYTDPFGYGTNAKPVVTWGGSTTYDPYHVYVGPDDMVYVNECGATTSIALGSGVWMMKPDLTSPTNLFPYNSGGGAITGNYFDVEAAQVQGSYSAGTLTLYTLEFDRSPFQSIWQYLFYTGSSPGTPVSLPWPTSSNPNALTPNASTVDIYGNAFSAYNGTLDGQVGTGIYSVNTVLGDFCIAPDGKFFCSEERTGGVTGGATGGNNALWVFDSVANGNALLWDSMEQNGATLTSGSDPLDPVLSVAVSPDDQFLAMGGTSVSAAGGNSAFAGQIEIMPLNYTNANGVSGLPNLHQLTSFKFNTAANEAMRQIAFDAADNIYAESGSSSDTMREFTLGFTTSAVTSNDYTGVNGAFALSYPQGDALPLLNDLATTPISSEGYGTPSPGVITFTRSGTAALLSSPITITYTLSGTATNNVNYQIGTYTNASGSVTTNSITFAANSTTITINVTNIESLTVPLPTLAANFNFGAAPAGYNYQASTTSTIYLANEGPQELFISGTAAPTMYRGLTNDFVAFTVTRWGDTNAGLYTIPASAISLTGSTAVYNTDYQAGPQPVNWFAAPTAGAGSGIAVNTGAQSVTFEVGMPLMHASYTGNLTIVAKMTAGTSMEGTNFMALTNTATATELDNLNPPESVIWSDLLTDPTDTNNWNVVFSQNATTLTGPGQVNATTEEYLFLFSPLNGQPYNGEPSQNFDANFGYNASSPILAPAGSGQAADYAPYGDGVDVAPSGAVNALRLTANKGTQGGSTAAAGVNVYPNNVPMLQGNYAVRFSMNLVRGCVAGTGSEFACFGINHYGTNANWWLSGTVAGSGASAFSFTNSDGIWFSIASDPGQFGSIGTPNSYASDFNMFTGTNGGGAGKYFPSTGFYVLNGASYTSFTNVFKGEVDYNSYDYNLSPYNFGYPLNGVPANQSGWGSDNYSSGYCPASGALPTNGPWTDVQIAQSNGTITMSLNKTVIFSYVNATPFTNGYPMLGYFDPYAGQGTGGGVYYSDIRAIELGPDILTQPVAATVGAGTNHTFTAYALGQGPYTNTLYTSPGNVLVTNQTFAGTTNDNVSLTVTSPTATTSYYIVISDASGSVTSSVVALTVDQPAIVQSINPPSITTYVGATTNFKATVTGTATVGYQWLSNGLTLANGGIVSGALTTNLVLSNLVVADSATYTIKATNAWGTNSLSATLTVLPPPPSFITNLSTNGHNVVIGFYSGDPYDTTNSFYVQGTTNLTGGIGGANGSLASANNWGFTNITGASLTFTLSGTNFTVTVPTNGVTPYQFYRVLHK